MTKALGYIAFARHRVVLMNSSLAFVSTMGSKGDIHDFEYCRFLMQEILERVHTLLLRRNVTGSVVVTSPLLAVQGCKRYLLTLLLTLCYLYPLIKDDALPKHNQLGRDISHYSGIINARTLFSRIHLNFREHESNPFSFYFQLSLMNCIATAARASTTCLVYDKVSPLSTRGTG